MATAGNLVFNLMGNSRHLEQTLGGAQKTIGSFVGTATKMLGALGAGLSFGKSISAAMELETASTQFEVLLGSGEAAEGMMERLRTFAAETPFAFPEIADSTKLLLNAGIAAEDMVDSLRMIGDLAAAGGKNLNEVAFVFSQVRSAGVLMGQDLNQLLNANIPAIKALADEFGVAESEVKKLVSTGAVTFDRLESAMQRLTGEGGQLNGMTQKLSQTTAGMWSTLQDNVTSVLAEFGTVFIESANVKGWMTSASALIGTVPDLIRSAQPVMEQFFDTAIAMGSAVFDMLSAGWTIVSDAAAVAFDFLGMSASVTFDGIVKGAVTLLAASEYLWKNFADTANLAFINVTLYAVTAFNEMSHWLGVTLPELLSFMFKNWQDIFFTVNDFTMTMFINMGKNIRNIMGEIWDFIASGGTDSLELAWTPLTEGFVNTISEIPELTKREISALEKSLMEEAAVLGDAFSLGLGEHVNKKMDELFPEADERNPLERANQLEKITKPSMTRELERETIIERESKEPKIVQQQALTAVSGMEAISAVNAFNREQDVAKQEKAQEDARHKAQLAAINKQTTAAEKTTGAVKDLAKSLNVAGAVQ